MPAARILLVEDSPTQAEVTRAFLNEFAHEMRLAATAAEGIAAALDWPPDVVLVDLQLPDGTGIDLMVALREALPEARAIVLTSFDDDDALAAALQAGAAAYVLKSVRGAGYILVPTVSVE